MYVHLPSSPRYGELLSKSDSTPDEEREIQELVSELTQMSLRDMGYLETFARDSGLILTQERPNPTLPQICFIVRSASATAGNGWKIEWKIDRTLFPGI